MEVSALTHPGRIPGLPGPSPLLRLQSDERLIALTRRGQHAAFEVLCSRYQSRLLSFCRHMLGSREDAEDILQEVFAAAFNAVLADGREINVRPWLYRIARNRSLNHLRRASTVGVDSMDVHYAEHGISTGEKVIRRESFRELIADVQKLPETQRTALLLREIDALSYEQIAHAMETTVPSVKSLLVRARISLAEAAEARKLSCDEVRLELGEVAEGLTKLSTPARRHVRGCERCSFFRRQLKENNSALALIMPVGPLLLIKKLLLAKLGTTASAGGAHVAGGAGATAGATASATAGAGAAAAGGGGGVAGLVTAGAGALATKAAIVTAAAAIVTAGAVAADHAVTAVPHRAPIAVSASAAQPASGPVVIHEALQPLSTAYEPARNPSGALSAAAARRARHMRAKLLASTTTTTTTASPTSAGVPLITAVPAHPVKPVAPQPTIEVTSETTELPASATSAPVSEPVAQVPSAPASEPPPPEATPTTPIAAPPSTPGGQESTEETPQTPNVTVLPDSGGTSGQTGGTSVAGEEAGG